MAPHRAVVIDPNDKSQVIIGTSKLYLNDTGDAIDPSTGTVDYSLVANPMNWSRVFDPQDFDDDPSSDPTTIHPLFSSNVERNYVTSIEWQTAASCDRVYMSIANTDEGDVGGIFYSDDGGVTWMADTLNGSSPRLSMPVNDLLVNDNFIWAGVGDRDGRSSEAGVRLASVSVIHPRGGSQPHLIQSLATFRPMITYQRSMASRLRRIPLTTLCCTWHLAIRQVERA